MKKKLKNSATNTDSEPCYVKAYDGALETVQISARIPIELKQKFEGAQEILRRYGKDMQLNDVMRNALQDAVSHVEERYGTLASAMTCKAASSSLTTEENLASSDASLVSPDNT